jgi:hypothetical protein
MAHPLQETVILVLFSMMIVVATILVAMSWRDLRRAWRRLSHTGFF